MSAVGDARKRLAESTQPDPTAAAVRAAQAEALYAARDALYRGEGPDLVADNDIVYGEWLGNRADRLATDAAAPEGFVDGSDFIDSLAAPVAVEGVETYKHAIYVNIGGTAKMPTVSLWCSDCLVPVKDFGQNNEWDALQLAVREHCSQMSRREQLSPVEPETSEPEGGESR